MFKIVATTFLFMCAIVLIFCTSLMFGETTIPFWNFNAGDPVTQVVLELRAMRQLTAVIVGGGLAVAGCACQAVLRNPLAEPYIMGISGGAGLGVASAICLGIVPAFAFALPVSAFIGALAALALVLFISRGVASGYVESVMLTGVIVGTVCSGLLMFLVVTGGAETYQSITWWMLGNLQPQRYDLVALCGIPAAVGVCALMTLSRETDLISLGTDISYYFGMSPRFAVILLLLLSALVTASVVSLAGIIGFVGLLIPHCARRFVGASHKRLYPACFVGGGLFLVMCDAVARSVIAPREIPVGVITAVIGGGFFLWKLNRGGRR